MTELVNLDLDGEVLNHLPLPESWLVFRGEGMQSQLIEDEGVREAYVWADNHTREYGQPPTQEVLTDEFDIEFFEPVTAPGDLIERLRMNYAETEGRKALKAIAEGYKAQPTALGKLLDQHGKQLQALLNRTGEVFGTGDYDRAKDLYYKKTQKGKGPSLGFEQVDDYFADQRGVTIFLGPPKTWKSWFMVNATISNVVKGIYPFLYSLELPAEETDMRLRCMVSGVPWHKYINDCISKDEWKLIHEASDLLDGQGAYRTLKPPRGERDLASLVGCAKDAGADCVLIDQLQYVEIKGKSLGSWNETGQYFDVLDEARNLSDEIPICFAHQFNRSVMNAEAMPSVHQAKGSAAIEETATLVLGLWASKEMRKSRVCELGTLAARNHDYRSWEVNIDLSKQCSLEIEKVIDEDE